MQSLRQRFANRENGYYVVHLVLIGVMLWLSIDFQLPGDELAKPAFIGFRKIADEHQWSYAFLLAAFVGTVGLITSYRWVQRLSILGLSTAHVSLAVLLLQGITPAFGVPSSTGIYVIIATAGYCLCIARFLE